MAETFLVIKYTETGMGDGIGRVYAKVFARKNPEFKKWVDSVLPKWLEKLDAWEEAGHKDKSGNLCQCDPFPQPPKQYVAKIVKISREAALDIILERGWEKVVVKGEGVIWDYKKNFSRQYNGIINTKLW